MFDFHQGKLTLKKNFVLMNEQRTILKWDVANSDFATQLKSVFSFCLVVFDYFFSVNIHEKIVLSISVSKVLVS